MRISHSDQTWRSADPFYATVRFHGTASQGMQMYYFGQRSLLFFFRGVLCGACGHVLATQSWAKGYCVSFSKGAFCSRWPQLGQLARSNSATRGDTARHSPHPRDLHPSTSSAASQAYGASAVAVPSGIIGHAPLIAHDRRQSSQAAVGHSCVNLCTHHPRRQPQSQPVPVPPVWTAISTGGHVACVGRQQQPGWGHNKPSLGRPHLQRRSLDGGQWLPGIWVRGQRGEDDAEGMVPIHRFFCVCCCKGSLHAMCALLGWQL